MANIGVSQSQIVSTSPGVTLNSTNNTIPKRASSTSLVDSSISDDGTNVTTTENIHAINFFASVAGGQGYSFQGLLPSNTGITTGGTTLLMQGGSGTIFALNGTNVQIFNGSPLQFLSGGFAQDTGISRISAGVIGIGTGANGSTAGNLQLNLITSYGTIATVSNGVPAEYATVDLTAQSAAISATTLYAVPAAGGGMYRISWSATITTAATTSSVLGGANGFQTVYTSPTDSVVKTTVAGDSIPSAANTTGTATGGVEIVYAKASTNIQYKFDYTSAGVTAMVFELHIKCEAM